MLKDLLYEIKGLVPDKVVLSLEEHLRISEDLDTEIDVAAKNYGYFAILSEKSESRHQKMKFAFESWQAETETRAAMERKGEGEKPFTEAQMKAHIKSQPKYSAFQSKLIELDEQRRILKSILKAFEIKSSLIQTKASNRRNEMTKHSRR